MNRGHGDVNGVAVTATTHYQYYLKTGEPITKTRIDYADGSKSFKWPTGTKMSDVGLYNQDLLKRLRPGEPWVLVEGEKTADALMNRGIVAVSLPGGSGQRDLSALDALAQYPENTGHISGDNDAVGLKAATAWNEHLKRIHHKIRWVPPVSEGPGGDFADLLSDFSSDDDAGARAAIFSRLERSLDGPPGPKPKVTLYTDTQLAEMELPAQKEVVPGLFGAGHYLLSGAPKMGKSFLVMSMAFALAHGGAALGSIHVDARDVLYLCLEDGIRRTASRLRQRSETMGTSGRLHFAFAWPSLDEDGLEMLRTWLEAHPDGVVFIDTGKRLRQGSDDGGKSYYSSDYDFIAPITDLAHDFDTMILTVWHDRKMLADDFFDQVNASRGLTAAVDGVASLSRERGSKDAKLSIGDRDTEDRAFALRWDEMLLGWLLIEQVEVAAAKSSPRVRVLMALRKLDSELGVDPSLIVAELGDMSLPTVRNHLTELRKEGAVIGTSKGRWRVTPADDTDTPE